MCLTTTLHGVTTHKTAT